MPDSFGTKEAFDSLGKQSPYCQIGIGVGTGLALGYIFFKASRSVAIAVGATILVIQLAMESGLMKVEADAIVLQGHQLSGNIPVVRSWELVLDQLAMAREIVAKSGRLCLATLGGFLVGFGLA